ncbi:hypothetical protein SBOR_3451 [Sclerotinia borealis F-4128]|uniref:Mitochondrial protein Fmp25 n=1 Tax=Sclerotinia borealis (strain F-4128) TaxID=1432307 RepID=W9CJX5_SCLBF|nr:hypothetical protein SBOR_3451 [Sclerotinia borealis F-4128]
MLSSKVVPRCGTVVQRANRHTNYPITFQKRYIGRTSGSRVTIASIPSRSRKAALLLSLTICAGGLYATGYPRALNAEEIPTPAELQFEKKRKNTRTKEENRDQISSQHLQVKRSWEKPGVYAWGSNTGRVVAPDSDETNIKTPRRIPYFDGKIIRDIKLDRNFAAAITENGDLLQWGTKYSPDSREPTPTLKGKDLVKISISKDRIIALSSSGTVYSISASRSDQALEPKPQESSWIPFWSSKSPIGYRTLNPDNMVWGEKINDISSGLEHCLLLTSKGRLFSAASGSEDYPTKGQLGIPGLTWKSRPPGPHDQPHLISTLKGFEMAKIATGDYHSLAVDTQGRVFSFGDNSVGQLGIEYNSELSTIDAPSLISIDRLYKGTNLLPRVTGVFAGGVNTFFTIDATRVAGQSEETTPLDLGRITADTWSCGQGIFGALGNGRWTHVQSLPSKMKALSGLFEYDEVARTVIPIRLSRLSIGSTHASAVMNNVTHLEATSNSSHNDTNWGADALWWGGNEFYQLGTGRRNNVSQPVYIQPLELASDGEKRKKEEHRFQITPRKTVKIGGRNVSVEQRIECGRGCTAVYSGA